MVAVLILFHHFYAMQNKDITSRRSALAHERTVAHEVGLFNMGAEHRSHELTMHWVHVVTFTFTAGLVDCWMLGPGFLSYLSNSVR